MRENLWRSIDSTIDARREWQVSFRRSLHATPEPSTQEQETTERVAEQLRESGLEPRVMANETGIVADVDLGAGGGSRVALRAELDCVPVGDEKAVPYASQRPGLCHACGHDAHSAILVGVARCLTEHRDGVAQLGLHHDLRLIFQPAEETATGARSMIDQGALDGVAAIMALHVDPFREVGHVGLRNGPMTAAAKLFRITVTGRSGHSARPHEALDPIPAAMNMISQLYQLAPRSMDSRYPMSLNVSSVNAGSAYNAIPEQAVLRGTLRATRRHDMAAVERRMRAIADGLACATDCRVVLEFIHESPETRNHPELVGVIEQSAREALGEKSVQWIDAPSLGGEDFAYYQDLVPGVFVRLGAALDDGRPRQPLHSALFDINEAALAAGTRFMIHGALELAAKDEHEPLEP